MFVDTVDTIRHTGPMTQTCTIQPAVQHAMVVPTPPNGRYLHFFTVESVEDARDEFGGTLADALLFADAVCCTECGTEAAETRPTAAFELSCRSCGAPGCRCILSEDPHAPDVWFCSDCSSSCGCRDCEG